MRRYRSCACARRRELLRSVSGAAGRPWLNCRRTKRSRRCSRNPRPLITCSNTFARDQSRHSSQVLQASGRNSGGTQITLARDRAATHRQSRPHLRRQVRSTRLQRSQFRRSDRLALRTILGKRIPHCVHWSKLDYLDVETAGDKKITWELNRHQYFMTLGQAYCVDRRRTLRAHLCRPSRSVDGCKPAEARHQLGQQSRSCFRSISWLWAFHFFKSSPSFRQRPFKRAWKFLYLSARHLESYLSTYFSPNTHLTGEALGLFYLGTLLPEFKEAKRWQDLGSEHPDRSASGSRADATASISSSRATTIATRRISTFTSCCSRARTMSSCRAEVEEAARVVTGSSDVHHAS